MPPFVSTNGLAGDVVVIKETISRREIEISSLQEQFIELENTREEEAEAIEQDIKRRIQDLEKQLKAKTQERSKKLEDLEIAYLKRTRLISERIDELQELNNHDRALIAPIRNLPTELLGNVFHHVDLNNSPWVLTLISRSWRHTAMITPSLWVHLLLCSVEQRRLRRLDGLEVWQVDRCSWYSTGRRVVCHDSSELNTIVSRAGSLPLDIHIITFQSDNASVVQPVLGDSAIARRIASLTINASEPRRIIPPHDDVYVTVGSFPSLHTLSILSAPEKLRNKILESISSSSPQLKHLITHQTIPLSLDFPFWSKLLSLNINRCSDSASFNNLIPHLGELEILEGSPPRWPNESTPEVSLPKLTTLGAFCEPEHLRRLQLPALLRLSIEAECGDAPMKSDGVPLISLPALEVLEAQLRASTSWLAILSAPCMRVLALRGIGRRTSGVPSFQNIHFPGVQDFILDYSCTDQVTISALECVPNAENVAVSNEIYGEQGGLELLQRLADVENMLCPNMMRFTLGSLDNKVAVNKASAEAHARRAIRNRMDRGVKMDHFEIHLKTHLESIQCAEFHGGYIPDSGWQIPCSAQFTKFIRLY